MKKTIGILTCFLIFGYSFLSWAVFISGSPSGGTSISLGCDDDPPVNQSFNGSDSTTYIYKDASTCGGYIDKIEAYINNATATGFQFAVFSCSGASCTVDATALKEDFTVAANLNTFDEGTDYSNNLFRIENGEYFGWFQPTNGNMDRDVSATGHDYYYKSNDQISASENDTYSDGTDNISYMIRVDIRCD